MMPLLSVTSLSFAKALVTFSITLLPKFLTREIERVICPAEGPSPVGATHVVPPYRPVIDPDSPTQSSVSLDPSPNARPVPPPQRPRT